MREADLMSRRAFLLTTGKATAGIAAGLVLGPDVFDYLDRLGPRRLLVNGMAPVNVYDVFAKELHRILGSSLLQLRQNSVIPKLTQRPLMQPAGGIRPSMWDSVTGIGAIAGDALLDRAAHPERSWPAGHPMDAWYR
jgi:hypothetical protein